MKHNKIRLVPSANKEIKRSAHQEQRRATSGFVQFIFNKEPNDTAGESVFNKSPLLIRESLDGIVSNELKHFVYSFSSLLASRAAANFS